MQEQEKYDVTYGSSHVEAIRLFELDRKRFLLRSLNGRDRWEPGEIKKAECSVVATFAQIHTEIQGLLNVPHIDCSCGIWSCSTRQGLHKSFSHSLEYLKMAEKLPPGDYTISSPFFWMPEQFKYFAARVEIWGSVIEHEWGYRSEYARIIPDSIHIWPRRGDSNDYRIVRNLRKRYNV